MVYSYDTNIMQNAIALKACLCQNDYTMIEETWGGDGMEYIDPVLIELEKLNARLSKEQVSSIYSLIRFEYPDLIEDKHRAFSFFDRLDFTQKELQELIVISNEIRVELTRERVHKSDGNRSPWQLFCAQYRSRFPSVSNRDFVQFYECITQISLQLPEELNVEKNVLNFISDVKKAYGNQTDQERILLQLFSNPAKFLNELQHNTDDSSRLIFNSSLKFIRKSADAMLYGNDALICLENDPKGSIPNDYSLENNYVYYQFTSLLNKEKDSALVVLPSPLFMKKWRNDAELIKIATVFAVENSAQAGILSKSEQGGSSYISVDHLADFLEENPAFSRNILLFQTHEPGGKLSEDLYGILRKSAGMNQFLMLTSDGYLKDSSGEIQSMLTETALQIERVSILPSGINDERKPSRKCLVYFRLMENSVENHVVISQYRLLKNQKYQALERRPLVLSMAMEELPSNLDFRSVYRQEFNSYERKSDAERNRAERIDLTDEVHLFYTESAGDDGCRRVRAFIKDPGSDEKKTMYQTQKSARNIPAGDVKEWVLTVYPYAETEYQGKRYSTRHEISSAYQKVLKPHDVSLKTFIYFFPECDSLIGNNADFNELMNGEIGSLTADLIQNDAVDRLLSEKYQSYEGEKTKYALKSILSAILDLAVKKGYAFTNDLHDAVEAVSNEKRAMYEVRSALVPSYFQRDVMKDLFSVCSKKYLAGDSRYLAVLIKLTTGLETAAVAALEWQDLKEVKEFGASFYQLIIRRCASFDGNSFHPLQKREAYRLIPVPDLLGKYIKTERDRQMEKLGIDTIQQMAPLAIVGGGSEHRINGITMIYSPSQINHLCRSILKKYIDKEEIQIPINESEFEQIDLRNYNGDIFRSNFRHFALSDCAYEKDEVDFLTGNKPDSTFARNYCDMENDASQYRLYIKQNRFARLFQERSEETVIEGKTERENYRSTLDPDHCTELDFTVEDAGQLTNILAYAQHGIDVDVVKIKKE